MSNFKLIALDIDGTLYNDKKQITPKTLKALIACQEKGAKVVLASGRPELGLRGVAELLQLNKHHGLIISYNGARARDVQSKEILFEQTIPQEAARKLLRYFEDIDVIVMIDNGTEMLCLDSKDPIIKFESDSNNLGRVEVKNFADSIDFSPCKILARGEPALLDSIREDVERKFSGKLSFVKSAPFYLEAIAFGVGKDTALKHVCKKLEIDKSQVISFGDAENDITMLNTTGYSVAMGNADDSIKQIADEVTLSNNDDGIAVVLAKFFGV